MVPAQDATTPAGGARYSIERFVSRVALEWEQDHAKRAWQSVPGTLCFIDISGFTALSERLARRGRIGAEELTEVLNRVFGSMLELSYARGGSLLKFGGDALLLFFTGDDRVTQACSAAVEMRAALREAAAIPTSVGRVALRMSVGIHDGRVDFFRVGTSHKELIVTGPVASVTTEMESAADAGEIVVSDTVVAALPPRSVGAAKGGGHLLRWRVPKAPPCGAVLRREVDREQLELSIPSGLGAYLSDGSSEPGHRLATVGFVKFKGIDALLRDAGPDAVAAALEALVSATQHAADREGVTFLASDIDADGGKLILVSGVPAAQEDDEGRMLRTARSIADSRPPLSVRIGVNRGHVFAGEIGTTFRATYTVMGDTVNLAARLMASAGDCQVYASPAVVDRSRTTYATEAIEPFAVKGKSELVHALSIGTETGAREENVRHELPFIGRDREFERTREVMRRAFDGEGEVVTLLGPVGSGKSRLGREAIYSFADAKLFVVRADAYASANPYRAMRDPMRSALGIERADNTAMASTLVEAVKTLDPELLPFAPLLGAVAHVEIESTPEVDAIEPEFRRERVADVVIRLFDRLLTGNLIVAVDDAQWLDDSSAHLLGRLAAESEGRPWAMIVARQPEETGFIPVGSTEIELLPLADDDIRQLVLLATETSALRPHEVDEIVARTGGSPLFAAEIVRAVAEAGTVAGLPESLEAVIGAQIDALPSVARRLLRGAAVLGRNFVPFVVERVLGDEGIAFDATARDELADFVEADANGMRFRHAMVRDVAYGQLPFRRRQALHLKAAETIESMASEDSSAVSGLLSLHFSLGQHHDKTWHYARVAGDRALETYSNVEAEAHYLRALDAARRLATVDDIQRAEVLTNLGDARERASMFTAALDAYRRACSHVRNDPVRIASLQLKRARARERSGAFSMALRELGTGMRRLDGIETRESRLCRARIAAFAAMVRWGQERSREALNLAEQAIREARAVGAREALAQALMVADVADLALHGTVPGTRLREALAIFEELGDLPRVGQALGNLGFVAAHAGRWPEAVECFTAGRDAFARSGDAVGTALVDLNLGEALMKQQRTDEAVLSLEPAARVLRSVGFVDGAAYAELQLAQCWAEFGRYDDAEQLLGKVALEFTELGQYASALEAAIALADIRLRVGDPAGVSELLDNAERAAGREASRFAARVALLRAKALLAEDDVSGAEAHIHRGLADARARGLPHEEAMLLLLADEVGQHAGRSGDASSRERAEEILAGLGVRR